jgi:8-oxo-dGTP pyrophosphatase MutT (NUDIX family)
MSRFLPLQVAAVCYRRQGAFFEFLLVNTTGGEKWTFPEGATARRLTHSEAAEREALEEAGAVGVIEPLHFHLYLQPKGTLAQKNGSQEFVVKAFLLEVTRMETLHESGRNPTWFSVADACAALEKGRDAKYAAELQTAIRRAVERLSAEEAVHDDHLGLIQRIWRALLKALKFS